MIRHTNSIVGNDITITLGDFNIDAYKENTNLKLLLELYTMIVSDPTHLSGSLLDHIYVKTIFLNTVTDLQCIVKGIFFSDHDSVKFQFKFS